VLRLEDVYPEILVATGLLTQQSPLTRLLALLTRMLYRQVDLITVLGRDMKALAEKKIGARSDHVQIIRSWADTDIVSPQPKAANQLLQELGLADKFVVSCVGNMGRAQAVELMLEAVTSLRNHPRIHFLFIGSGAKKDWLQQEVVTRQLTNITILNHRPRTEQMVFLNACDLSIISLLPGMTGAGVPSRTYNIMAAGKPIIALTGVDSEVSLLVQELQIGWVVPPDSVEALVLAMLEASSDPERLSAMGARAAQVALERFSRATIIDEYQCLLESRLIVTSTVTIKAQQKTMPALPTLRSDTFNG
jgi:glycosyltransferase involved in cell wall biosynthesis